MWGLGGHQHLEVAVQYVYKGTEVSDDPWCEVGGESLVPDDLLGLWREANIQMPLLKSRARVMQLSL